MPTATAASVAVGSGVDIQRLQPCESATTTRLACAHSAAGPAPVPAHAACVCSGHVERRARAAGATAAGPTAIAPLRHVALPTAVRCRTMHLQYAAQHARRGRHRCRPCDRSATAAALGPDRLPPARRHAACDLALRTAIELHGRGDRPRASAAIENYAHAQVVRCCARSRHGAAAVARQPAVEGDWRLAHAAQPRARCCSRWKRTGAALFQLRTRSSRTGMRLPVQCEQQLRELLAWVPMRSRRRQQSAAETTWSCSARSLPRDRHGRSPRIQRQHGLPPCSRCTSCRAPAPTGSYVVPPRATCTRSGVWAGDPNNARGGCAGRPEQARHPLAQLRGLRGEIVRGTAVPWSIAERVMARAAGRGAGGHASPATPLRRPRLLMRLQTQLGPDPQHGACGHRARCWSPTRASGELIFVQHRLRAVHCVCHGSAAGARACRWRELALPVSARVT